MRFLKALFSSKKQEKLTAQPNTSGKPEDNGIPNGDYRFVALDVETANSHNGSICQIGIACVDHKDQITTHSYYVDPQTAFDSFNIGLHGIDESRVRGAPNFANMMESLRPLLERHELIQHSSFDSRAITAACKDHGVKEPRLNWHDSVVIARRAWPNLKGKGGHGLANLKEFLVIDFKHHDAGEDAKAAAMVVLYAEKDTGLKFEELAVANKKRKQYRKPVTRTGDKEGAYFGMNVVFTGSLTMARSEIADLAAKAGMTVKSGVSKKTDILVVGTQELALLAGHTKSTKHRKAEELQAAGQKIRILGEDDFLTTLSKGQ